jgi:tripartite-type tricarboxylate transporter receptor subunit TctC
MRRPVMGVRASGIPVAGVIRAPFVMEVSPTVPAKTIPEFITYAKANSGKISMASAGIGTVSHIACELFKMMTGVSMVHVPYRGTGPALTDLIGGQVQIFLTGFPHPSSTSGPVNCARLRSRRARTCCPISRP